MSGDTAQGWRENLEEFPCHTIDTELIKNAIVVAARHHLPDSDGAILAAADEPDAPAVYSEDFNYGQINGEVGVRAPFTDLPLPGFHNEALKCHGDPAEWAARSDDRNPGI